MNRLVSLTFGVFIVLLSCSEDESDKEAQIIGSWKLERIEIEGADCQVVFGEDVPTVFLADAMGCAVPLEVLGNAKRCFNLEFQPNGEGTFFWSQIGSQQDVPITYNVIGDEVEYCFENSICNGPYILSGNSLESKSPLRLDQDCSIVYVLSRY